MALLPGSAAGYVFLLTPRWEYLSDPTVWIQAMGQAFFSLSITGSGMIVYGAYLSRQEDVVGAARHTALFDTVAALVAALVILPACFAYGLDAGAGPGLLFVTLPEILQDIPMGRLFAAILYVAMIFAGVSSLQNMFEAVAESLLHRFPRLNRLVVLGILGTYLNGIVLDHFIFGLNLKKRVCIISEKEEEIRQFILHTLHSGATIYQGFGAFDNEPKTEIITIVDKNEYAQLMPYILKTDPKAFVTVYTVNEIIYRPKR